jgi:hypothetical protein
MKRILSFTQWGLLKQFHYTKPTSVERQLLLRYGGRRSRGRRGGRRTGGCGQRIEQSLQKMTRRFQQIIGWGRPSPQRRLRPQARGHRRMRCMAWPLLLICHLFLLQLLQAD